MEVMPPKVSVVLPTYSRADLLPGAIDSILAQTFTDWELIVVDDCSTDETPEVIAHYEKLDPRIRSIRNEPNKRLPASLNVGMDAAAGDYLTWTSDDNFFRPQALERMVAELDADPDLGVVYADCMLIDDDLKELGIAEVDEQEVLLQWNCVRGCFMYRREVHERLHGYDVDRFLVEDWDFWLRASMEFKLKPIKEDLYLYRMHDRSLTATRLQDIHRKTALLIEEYLGKVPYAQGNAKLKSRFQLIHYGKMSKMPGFMVKHAILALVQNPLATSAHLLRKIGSRLGLVLKNQA
jgi:glycosyltransferase involved in cell wall biosynthesis